jgi:hypothetical protein
MSSPLRNGRSAGSARAADRGSTDAAALGLSGRAQRTGSARALPAAETDVMTARTARRASSSARGPAPAP